MRTERLAAIGYRVLRFTHDQLRYRPDWVYDQLHSIFRATQPTDIADLARKVAAVN